MKKRTEQQLQEAVMGTGLLLPISLERRGGRLTSLWRQVPGQEKTWLEAVNQCLLVFEPEDNSFVIARRYLLKDKKMVYGWHMEFNCPTTAALDIAVTAVISSLRGIKAEPAEVYAPKAKQQTAVKNGKKLPSLRTISSSTDDKGNRYGVEEMPLAHVSEDINIPTKPTWNERLGRYVGGDKGAKYVGGG